jgi:hypothetical protein
MIKKNKIQNSTSRRQFLKKTVYTAPSLLVLGKLLSPIDAVSGNNGSSTIFGGTSGGSAAPGQSNSRVRP